MMIIKVCRQIIEMISYIDKTKNIYEHCYLYNYRRSFVAVNTHYTDHDLRDCELT